MVRRGLLAVWLLDHVVDMDRAKNRGRTLVVIDNDSVTARRDVGVIG
jgi:hypothetical protein